MLFCFLVLCFHLFFISIFSFLFFIIFCKFFFLFFWLIFFIIVFNFLSVIFVSCFIFYSIKLFLGPIGDALGFRASSFRVNHNRILILILASYLNILPGIFSQENNNKNFNFFDQNEKQKIKKVENEVEKVKSNLGKLFSSGWSVFQIFEQIKHKLIKKGENVVFFLYICAFFCIYFVFFHIFLYFFIIIFVFFVLQIDKKFKNKRLFPLEFILQF